MSQAIAPECKTGHVLRKDIFRLEPIAKKLNEVENIKKMCSRLGMSRNHLYLIMQGKTGTTEARLESILRELGLNWSDIEVCPSEK